MNRITVRLATGEEFEVRPEEFHPYEPSAYCHDPGWTCYRGDDEFFVSQSGSVWAQPGNTEVGVAPAIKAAADKLDAQWAYEPDEETGLAGYPDGNGERW